MKAKIYQKEAELLDRGFVITAELLRDAYFDKVESLKEHSLMNVLEEHNSQCRSMVGKTVAKSTYFNFEHGGKLLQEYMGYINRKIGEIWRRWGEDKKVEYQ